MDFSLGQYQYNIREIDAEAGSFLAMKLVNKLRQIMTEADASEDNAKTSQQLPKEEAVRGTISLVLMNLDEAEYKLIQRKALAQVDRMESVGTEIVAVPIMRNGVIAPKDLKTDIGSVMTLTLESLFRNLAPFFSENGLKLLMTGKA